MHIFLAENENETDVLKNVNFGSFSLLKLHTTVEGGQNELSIFTFRTNRCIKIVFELAVN